MRALLFLALLTGAAQADMYQRCKYPDDQYLPGCRPILPTELLRAGFDPPGFVVADIIQFQSDLYLYVERVGPVTGNEGVSVSEAICGHPEWSRAVDNFYRVSVRMTSVQGDLTILDEIAFIDDCEAN